MNKKTKKTSESELWDTQAEFWAEQIRSGKDVFRDLFNIPEFSKFIVKIKGKKVLDAGCGEGYNTRIFAKQGARVTGIDLSENMIHLAKEEEQKNPLGIEYRVASFTDLSAFGDNSFDIVLSTMALMDGPGYKDASKEFYRVLKPNGSLIFSIIHPCFLTPHYQWLKNEHGNVTRLSVGNYFKEEPWEFTWNLAKKADKSDVRHITSLTYHRTLSTYINTLIETGFILKKIGEPRPSVQACEHNPRLQRARDVATPFLYVHAIKPF